MDSLSYPPEQTLEPQFAPESDVDEPEFVVDNPESDVDESESGIYTRGWPVVLGPSLPDVKPLGETIRIRIDLKGFRGLDAWKKYSLECSDTPGRYSYRVRFSYVSKRGPDDCDVYSSYALEGEGLFQGIVQWDETLWIDCPELSYIEIHVSSKCHEGTVSEYDYYWAELSIADFLAKSQVSCHLSWDTRQDESYLLYTASAVILSDGEPTRTSKYCTHAIIHHEWPEAVSIGPAGALSTCLRRFPHFFELVGSSATSKYFSMLWMYKVYQIHLTPQSCYGPRIDEWQSAIMEAMDAVMRLPQERIQCRRDDIQSMVLQLWAVATCMYDLVNDYPDPFEYSYVYISDLARLVHIITAPDPTSGTGSISASTNRLALSRALAKEALLITLEAIVQSSDAFPPLKSAASGLLFFATYADMASSNKRQIRDIYKRVDGLGDSLKHGMMDGGSLSAAHQGIISALAKDIASIQQDMEDIVNERKNHFKRYLRAKRHREELQDVVWQLDNARANYTAAVATLNATTITEVRDHVKAITLVLNAYPLPASGTRRADAWKFPFSPARIEEA